MTIVEKILARASGQSKTAAGQQVTARIDLAFMPDAFRMVGIVLKKAGIKPFKVWDPEKVAAVIDHRVPPTALDSATNQKYMRELAEQLGLKYFYDVFPGIGHQIMVQNGHVLPGYLAVGADSHTTTYGAVNAASTGIGASEMAFVLKTGELWFKVPETIKVEVTGSLGTFIHAKDVILEVARKYSTEMAQYKAIEWTGQAIDEMTMDSRMTISNMSVELGAKSGIFRADQTTIRYLKGRTTKPINPVDPDPDAIYCQEIVIDGAGLGPKVAVPHNVGNVKDVGDIRDVKINQAVIASCCHGRMEDMEIAAKIVKGKRVAPGVRFWVAPASWEEYKKAVDSGIISTLVEAGVMIGNPSCGFCTGIQGVLADGEVCVAASPRNFKGRMGSNNAEIYLGSPATVAASAVAGKIVDPREVA
jgi:3-isopropylmalate/(R)-2-methylmalate dehydratase large subunit